MQRGSASWHAVRYRFGPFLTSNRPLLRELDEDAAVGKEDPDATRASAAYRGSAGGHLPFWGAAVTCPPAVRRLCACAPGAVRRLMGRRVTFLRISRFQARR